MRIHLQKENTWIDEQFSGSAAELLSHLNVNPETVLIVKDGVLITPQADVSGAREIVLLSVISGG